MAHRPSPHTIATPRVSRLALVAAVLLGAITLDARQDTRDTADTERRAVVALTRSDNPELSRPVAPDQPLDADQVEAMVRRAVREAGGLESVLAPDARRVVIKPNLVEVKRSGDGTITDWRVVRAVARIAHEIAPAAIVKVIEACNWDVPGGERWKEDGWGYAGYDSLRSEDYLRLVNVNFDSVETRRVPGGGFVRDEYPVPLTMDTVDCFIDVPVVKIIGVVGMTAAMKNLVGMLPNGESGRQGLLDHSYGWLDEGIAELNLLHPVDFVVSDVIVGLERAKTTSWDGHAVRMNTVLASADVVAAAAVSARLIGLNPATSSTRPSPSGAASAWRLRRVSRCAARRWRG